MTQFPGCPRLPFYILPPHTHTLGPLFTEWGPKITRADGPLVPLVPTGYSPACPKCRQLNGPVSQFPDLKG